MRCRLGKQAIVDAVLDYLEDKYALPSAHHLSPLERIAHLREWRKWEGVTGLRSVCASDGDDDKGKGDDDDWDNRPSQYELPIESRHSL